MLTETRGQGMAFVGVGVILNFQGVQTYVVDAFTLHAASGKYHETLQEENTLMFRLCSAGRRGVFAIFVWFRLPIIRPIYVRIPRVWKRRYHLGKHCYCDRMPGVRIHRSLRDLNHFTDDDPLGLSCSGSTASVSAKLVDTRQLEVLLIYHSYFSLSS